VMAKHFRLELNIGADEPLPNRMREQMPDTDGDLIAETDPREKYQTSAEEKKAIEKTRNLLAAWFPI